MGRAYFLIPLGSKNTCLTPGLDIFPKLDSTYWNNYKVVKGIVTLSQYRHLSPIHRIDWCLIAGVPPLGTPPITRRGVPCPQFEKSGSKECADAPFNLNWTDGDSGVQVQLLVISVSPIEIELRSSAHTQPRLHSHRGHGTPLLLINGTSSNQTLITHPQDSKTPLNCKMHIWHQQKCYPDSIFNRLIKAYFFQRTKCSVVTFMQTLQFLVP